MTRAWRRAARAVVAILLLAVLLASIVIVSGWGAWRTDGGDRANGPDPATFDSSSIDLNAGSGDATLSATNMVPGDSVKAAITLANSGSQQMTYAMTSGPTAAGGAALSAALALTIKTVGSSCAAFDGTTLFDGPLDHAAFGSEGDGRSLPAATAEILCFRATLPHGTGDALQGTATAVTLTFGAGLAAVR